MIRAFSMALLFVAGLVSVNLGQAQAQAPAPKADLANIVYLETKAGRITIQLRPDLAPKHVERIKELTKRKFYDGVVFHRVIEGFMAQTGDPTGTGRGGPGYRFNDEASALKNRHSDAGILSMANAGPNTNGSQFFITYGPTPHLDGKHAVFGTVVKGLDVLKSISERDPGRSSTPGDVIETIEITVA